MFWINYKLENIDKVFIKKITDVLTNCGAISISIKKDKNLNIDHDIIATSSNKKNTFWRKVKIEALFPQKTFKKTYIQEQLIKEANIKIIDCIQTIKDKNWVQSWEKQTKPIKISNHLYICPSHCNIKKSHTQIKLDPGLAFGTGQHPSTYLCLKWLEKNTLTNKTILDYGCGSGILSIASYMLGAKKIFAIDNDPMAVKTTLYNCKLNNVKKTSIKLCVNKDQLNKKVDIIIANIYLDTLIKLKKTILFFLKKNGILILSGILYTQKKIILEQYKNFMVHKRTFKKNEWILIELKKMS